MISYYIIWITKIRSALIFSLSIVGQEEESAIRCLATRYRHYYLGSQV